MWTNTYYDWMNNIRDWCVSRQIWWGHQIPAWTCGACGEIVVAMEAPQACQVCDSKDLVQETDVLDTWFSSALWPFSTMGWPQETPLLKTFYPTSALVTGFDILFFWVARMMMMGIHFMGQVPFKEVYVHALVRDEAGKKMSKSKGNVIDPLSVIERYGTDAFRFTLAAFAAQGRDIKMSEKRVDGYRHFINKLWNAARFSLMHLDRGYEAADLQNISLPDKWILSRLQHVTREVTAALDSYRFNEAAAAIYNFVWHEFCDWYLEAIKPALYDKDRRNTLEATRAVLWRVLRDTLVLLHPFIPFVTEEIWHHLPGTDGSIMKAVHPVDAAESNRHRKAEAEMALLMAVITGIRNVRGEMNIAPSLSLQVQVQSDDRDTRKICQAHQDLIINLARLSSLTVENPGQRPKSSATAVVNSASIFVSLEGIIDFAKETQRLERAIKKFAAELTTVAKKLGNEGFLTKAPAEVVEKVRQKQSALLEKQQKIQTNLDKIKEVEA
jgi:valyl-tRNA synthetase